MKRLCFQWRATKVAISVVITIKSETAMPICAGESVRGAEADDGGQRAERRAPS